MTDPSRAAPSGLEAALAALADLFGERLTTGQAVREQHGRGEAYHPTRAPDAVLMARSTEDVAAAVRICARGAVPVIAFGAGTSLEGQVSAARGGVAINLSGLDAVVAVRPDDFDCTVGAGVTRRQLNLHLRDRGLFFPVDPGADATIGGMAATRASGTNAVRYGTMRENVLSLTVVLASGDVIRTGGRARKSASGYDLTRLFVGSEGTLGLITEITLRLHGLPEEVAAATCVFPGVADAVQSAIGTIQAGVPVARMELMDARMMKAVNRFSGLAHPEAPTLFFEFHGSPAGVREQAARASEVAAGCGGSDFAWAVSPAERTRLWQARHDAFYAVVSQRAGARGWASDVCVPLSHLADCILAASDLIATASMPAAITGHVGDGNFHVVFAVDPDSPAEMEEVSRINGEMVALALARDGTCTGEHGIGTGKIRYLEAEHGNAVAVMRAMKTALDPGNLLNPGKILPSP